MSGEDDSGPTGDGDDLLAAEYVLGLLPPEERRTAAARLARDEPFARRVERWEARLAPLAEAYEPAEPPASAKAAIDRRLFAAAPPGAPAAAAFVWGSLGFWRGLAAAALAVLAIMTRLTDVVLVALAWGFVLARCAHVYIHTTSNDLTARGGVYGIGALILLAMWIWFLLRFLAAGAA